MLGPLFAFGLLVLVPQGFNSVFVVSFVFAILGVAMLALFVRNPPREASAKTQQPTVTVAAAARLMGRGPFARLVVAASLIALFTISDGFVYWLSNSASTSTPASSLSCTSPRRSSTCFSRSRWEC